MNQCHVMFSEKLPHQHLFTPQIFTEDLPSTLKEEEEGKEGAGRGRIGEEGEGDEEKEVNYIVG